MFNIIQRLSFNLNKQCLFAFTYFKEQKELEEKYQGWRLYNIKSDFERMNIYISGESGGT